MKNVQENCINVPFPFEENLFGMSIVQESDFKWITSELNYKFFFSFFYPLQFSIRQTLTVERWIFPYSFFSIFVFFVGAAEFICTYTKNVSEAKKCESQQWALSKKVANERMLMMMKRRGNKNEDVTEARMKSDFCAQTDP